MKKNTTLIVNGLLVLFTYLIVSCDNKKEAIPPNVIPVASTVGNYNILNLSDFATDIRYIPLETNDVALIGNILQISYENEKILIRDITSRLMHNCYLFDNNGKFCRKIGQWGQGPDDYLHLEGAFIHENSIYLMESNKMLIYDTNGFLIENNKIRLNEILPKNRENRAYYNDGISPLKKDTFIMNVSSFGSYPKAVLIETHQSDVKIINEYPNYVKMDKLPTATLSNSQRGTMYRFKDDVRIYKGINDTIFTIGQNTEVKEAFIFDFGKYGIPLAYIEGKEPFEAGGYYIYPFDIFESFNHLFITFYFGHHTPEPVKNHPRHPNMVNVVYGVFDKITGEFTLMKQPIKEKAGFRNDIDNGPVIWPCYISSNNELVTLISVEDFMDYYDKIENPTPQLTEIAKSIDMDDNQIVIIAKLKE